ncbi:hypothetical protein L798_13424 [Zootermopsis nevadensis]|uniref:Uncharacterized protein n=2 Tax=Zootermopsis nevadensis TaxID=136037 RepID=A0A067QP72_ZOONE|nr:hypothetical protein L798_13424 [Zootermopsis nevadensis]
MEGRLMLVHLMCKDAGVSGHDQSIFTPCVAFRVAGTPSVREWSFAADTHNADGDGRGLSVTEYIAIGVCSILLGLIYVASVFLYLHVRRRRRGDKHQDRRNGQPVHLSGADEGVVKSNPLLATKRHPLEAGSYLSDSGSCCSDSDAVSDVPMSDDNNRIAQNVQVTAALVHSCGMSFSMQPDELCFSEPIHTQEQSSIERLPEENVSIVETLEGREERPETVRAITNGTARRKLYFNPAYFEPELLVAPPPAAIEFLTKIREVISIAKHKMLAKRFSPTLIGIPEEEQLQQDLTNGSYYGGLSSKRGSVGTVSLKRENARHRGCPGCPGCTTRPVDSLLTVKEKIASCQACCAPENKHSSIRKWLEDVPVTKISDQILPKEDTSKASNPIERGKSSQKGKAPSIPKTDEVPKRNKAVDSAVNAIQNPKHCNGKLVHPPQPPPSKVMQHIKKDASVIPTAAKMQLTAMKTSPCPTPPPLPSSDVNDKINSVFCKENKKEVVEPVVTKQLMDAVIKELVGQRGLETVKMSDIDVPTKTVNDIPEDQKKSSGEEYEADSLERSSRELDEEGISTPTEYGDVSPQPSSSLSSALPLEEVLTMRNEIFNIQTGSKTISKLKLENTSVPKEASTDDHEYEIIVLNPDAMLGNMNNNIKLYNLPQLLNNSNGYSLVSEVYVNDGYNFSSTSSSPNNTTSRSTSGPKIRYSEPVEKPGHLTIQVEDSPENYIPLPDDSDSFEPDTLDRKPNKHKADESTSAVSSSNRHTENFNDSLERPVQILLRTTGSFRSDSLSQTGSDDLSQILTASPLNRGFGSLREIYEARTQHRVEMDSVSLVGSTRSLTSELDYNHTLSWKRRQPLLPAEGMILYPEAKQARRQRPPTPPGIISGPQKPEPPNIIPPLPPKACSLYEDPPPPRPLYKIESTPPLPPRSIKPPLPPKNGAGRSISQKRMVSDPARRPLPPLPQSKCHEKSSPIFHEISTISSTSTSASQDLETISNLSGASVDSLNSSDYEAFYMTPFSGDEEPDGSQTLGQRVEQSLKNKFTNSQDTGYNNQLVLQPVKLKAVQGISSLSTKSYTKETESDNSPLRSRQSAGKDLMKHLRDKKSSDSVRKTWRRMVERSASEVPHKPEDSGYLSTDSNESNRHVQVRKASEGQNSSQGQGSVSETDESLCDGASESGAESIATDSFFFGSFRKLSTCAVVTESVDSGVGSDLVRTMNSSVLLEDAGASSSDSENVSFVTVLPPGSGHRRSIRS